MPSASSTHVRLASTSFFVPRGASHWSLHAFGCWGPGLELVGVAASFLESTTLLYLYVKASSCPAVRVCRTPRPQPAYGVPPATICRGQPALRYAASATALSIALPSPPLLPLHRAFAPPTGISTTPEPQPIFLPLNRAFRPPWSSSSDLPRPSPPERQAPRHRQTLQR